MSQMNRPQIEIMCDNCKWLQGGGQADNGALLLETLQLWSQLITHKYAPID